MALVRKQSDASLSGEDADEIRSPFVSQTKKSKTESSPLSRINLGSPDSDLDFFMSFQTSTEAVTETATKKPGKGTKKSLFTADDVLLAKKAQEEQRRLQQKKLDNKKRSDKHLAQFQDDESDEEDEESQNVDEEIESHARAVAEGLGEIDEFNRPEDTERKLLGESTHLPQYWVHQMGLVGEADKEDEVEVETGLMRQLSDLMTSRHAKVKTIDTPSSRRSSQHEVVTAPSRTEVERAVEYELLVGGWLWRQCLNSGQCPPWIARWLFTTVASSSSSLSSSSASQHHALHLLLALLLPGGTEAEGAGEGGSLPPPLMGLSLDFLSAAPRTASPSAGPPIHCPWVPTSDHFLAAFKAFGCVLPDLPEEERRLEVAQQGEAADPLLATSQQNNQIVGPGNVQLLLELLTALSSSSGAVRWTGTDVLRLSQVLWCLWVDPRTSAPLHSHIHQAAGALLTCLPDPDWKEVKSAIAVSLAECCSTPHAALRLLSLLPLASSVPSHHSVSRKSGSGDPSQRLVELRRQAACLLLENLRERSRPQVQAPQAEAAKETKGNVARGKRSVRGAKGKPPPSPAKLPQGTTQPMSPDVELPAKDGDLSKEDAVSFAVNLVLTCDALNPLMSKGGKRNVDYWLVLTGLKVAHMVIWECGLVESTEWDTWSHFLKKVNGSIKTTLQQSRAEVKHYAGKWHMAYEQRCNKETGRRESLG